MPNECDIWHPDILAIYPKRVPVLVLMQHCAVGVFFAVTWANNLIHAIYYILYIELKHCISFALYHQDLNTLLISNPSKNAGFLYDSKS